MTRAEIIDELDFTHKVTVPLIEAGKCDAKKAVNALNETEWEECIAKVEAMKSANPSVMTYIRENTWKTQYLLLIIGPLIALFGKRLYPYIAATVGFIIVTPLIFFFCSG